MDDNERSDLARLLVMDALSLSLFLGNVVTSVLEDLSDEAFPGENPAEALIEMVVGSVRWGIACPTTFTRRGNWRRLPRPGDSHPNPVPFWDEQADRDSPRRRSGRVRG
jgi:hypothetical protein